MKHLIRRSTRVVAALTAVALGMAAVAASGGAIAASASKKPLIIWLEQGAGNPYWTAQHLGAADEGLKLGYNFKAVSGNLSSSDQAAILKQLVNQKPGAIILNAIDPAAMVPSLEYATRKGVPVLSIYADIPQATASVEFNENRSGRIDAQYAVKLLTERYGSPKGTIAILLGILGQPASDLRAAGFVDYMKKYPGIKIVAQQPTEWDASQASAAMEDWLTKYPNLSMVYGLSDTITVPALTVAQRQNRLCTTHDNWTKNPSCVAFVSVDGSFLDDVVTGQLYSTEVYSPQWTGYIAGRLSYFLALHKMIAKNTILDSLLVTSQNGACVLKMVNAMTNHTLTFPFNAGPTLAAIASKEYHCATVS